MNAEPELDPDNIDPSLTGAAAPNGEIRLNGDDHDHDHDAGDIHHQNGDTAAAADATDGAGAGAGVIPGMQGERQPNKVRMTTPYLTKYERARVLGTRALQIRSVFLFFFFSGCLTTVLF